MTRPEPGPGVGGGSTGQTGVTEIPSGGDTSVRHGQAEAAIVRLAVDVIRARWVIPILTRLCVEPTPFNQLRRELEVSSKVLTGALRAMERDGLVARTPPDHAGGTGSYSLTSSGAALQPALRALLEWARTNGNGIEQSRIRYDETARDRGRVKGTGDAVLVERGAAAGTYPMVTPVPDE